jgi:hypothetical protein
MKEREKKVSNRTISPSPTPSQKGGNACNNDREGLGLPPRELALLLALPQHQPTTIPPFLRKARDRKEEKCIKQSTSLPSPVPSQKGGNCRGRRSRRTRVATLRTRTAFRPS